ncbi:MAG: hypothetical protein GVY17_14620 [Cyanobacteria bacterium]|jgi:cell division protein FtsB|nr:hypothetical protein [Cyanobacteria bacterium GSL.Bin21]
MTSNSRFQGMTSSSPHQNTPTVPMSVYRELAGELQTTQRQLDGLKQNNQHLHQENQALRLEIKKLVQSVQQLETTLNDWDQHSSSRSTQPTLKQEETYYYTPPSSAQEHWLSHQPAPSPRKEETRQNEGEINGWFVIAALVMIIFTFSGIGFMVARPLLNQSSQN